MVPKEIYEHFKTKIENGKLESIDIDRLFNDTVVLFTDLYLKKEYKEITDTIVTLKRLIVYLKRLNENEKYFTLESIGRLSGLLISFTSLIKKEASDRRFINSMVESLDEDLDKEIIMYLYKNPDSVFEDIMDECKIEMTIGLRNLMNDLEEKGIVSSIVICERRFFSLTCDAVEFVIEKVLSEDKEGENND